MCVFCSWLHSNWMVVFSPLHWAFSPSQPVLSLSPLKALGWTSHPSCLVLGEGVVVAASFCAGGGCSGGHAAAQFPGMPLPFVFCLCMLFVHAGSIRRYYFPTTYFQLETDVETFPIPQPPPLPPPPPCLQNRQQKRHGISFVLPASSLLYYLLILLPNELSCVWWVELG